MWREKKVKYSISDIANLLGISIVTVRNYEKCGLIEPVRNEQNNYRQYNAIDMNLIRRARSYMSYGFSLNESTGMIFDKDLSELSQLIQSKECQIEKQILRDHQLLRFLREHSSHLQRVSASIGECIIEMSPALFGFTYREGLNMLKDEKLLEVTRYWNEIRPFAETFQVFALTSFIDGRIKNQTGLCIGEKYAKFFGIREDEYIRYYPPRKSIYAIVQYTFEPDVNRDEFEFDFVAEFAKRKGVNLAGDAIGRVLHTSKSTGKWLHYIEIWVPIE